METRIDRLDPRIDALLPPHAAVERLWTGGIWCEGPAWLPREGVLVWSDIPNDRTLELVDRAVRVREQPARFQNGHTVDREGRLLACEHGTRRLVRHEHDGTTTVLADRYAGRRLNSPNDVVVQRDGTIWFSDPPYGILSDREGHRADPELDRCNVFRIDATSGELTIATGDLAHPNGLAFSPDERTLYVSDTSAAVDPAGGNHHIRRFAVAADGTLAGGEVFVEVAPGFPDGFRVDEHGNVWTSSGDGIQVYAPDATRLGTIVLPEPAANCTFAGPDGTTLFITASASLYRVATSTRGAA